MEIEVRIWRGEMGCVCRYLAGFGPRREPGLVFPFFGGSVSI